MNARPNVRPYVVRSAKPERPDPATVFPIQRGIPMPSRGGGSPRQPCPYPFLDCQVGETFFVPLEDGDTLPRLSSRIRNWADRERERHNMPGLRFRAIRTEEEIRGVRRIGVRVWRRK